MRSARLNESWLAIDAFNNWAKILKATLVNEFLVKDLSSGTHKIKCANFVAPAFAAGPRSAVGRASTRKSEVLGSIPGLATYFRVSFRCFKRGSCQLLAKVFARSTG